MSYTMDNRPAKGTALYARKLLEQFTVDPDPRFEFTLIHYHKNSDPLYRSFKEIQMPFVQLPYGSQFLSQMRFFWKLRKQKFDIIHWLQPRLYPFYWLAPARAIVVTVHGAGQMMLKSRLDLSKSVFNFLMRYLSGRVDAFIAVSESGRKEIIKHYRTDSMKTHTVYHGVDEKFYEIDKRIASETCVLYGITQPFILDVSRLQPHKNVISLVKAFILLRETYPERREKLVVIGTALESAKEIYDTAQSSAYTKDIHFIDFVPDEHLNQFYSAAEIFVFPSLLEGFGLPLVEAMAAGVPIITSNSSSLPEVAGEAAILVDPTDIQSIAQAMHDILSDSHRANELRQKGLERAKLFSWRACADATKEIYRKVVVDKEI